MIIKPNSQQIVNLSLLAQGSLGVLCPTQTAEAMARRGWVIIGDYDTDGYCVKITDKGRAVLAAVYGEEPGIAADAQGERREAGGGR